MYSTNLTFLYFDFLCWKTLEDVGGRIKKKSGINSFWSQFSSCAQLIFFISPYSTGQMCQVKCIRQNATLCKVNMTKAPPHTMKIIITRREERS
mmetsp:Transcript_2272/g.2632  ORF Transcript_2272/g.2632 Transcript_2272/m.2632 type:complete len:94 (-) Transcript_2272:33-314(-)